MHKVSGLPLSGDNTTNSIREKDAAQEEVYTKFGMRRGKRRVVILEINNLTVMFATQLLACKLLRKCQRDECPIGVVLVFERCATGVQMCSIPYIK
jgi:hypothetical protein